MTTNRWTTHRKTFTALAVMALCAPAWADDEEVKQLTQPQSAISIGVSGLTADPKGRSMFGQYSGLRNHDAVLNLDVSINKRDSSSGTALYVIGSDLGLDDRDLFLSYEKQGDWKAGATYSELTHREIRTVNTGLQGAGSTTPTIVRLATPGTGSDLDQQLKRVGLGLSFEKWITPQWQAELSFKNEDKTGSRVTGRGYACAAYVCNNTQSATNQTWALLMLPEPVNSSIKQIEAKLNFRGQALSLSAGYYGSFYTNNYGSYQATVPNILNNPLGVPTTLAPAVASSVIAGGGLSLQNVLQLPFALPPDNQAHQFYLSGNYRFTPTTNSTFKLAYTHATQNEDFASAGLTGAPAGVTNLGGVVDNTLVQLGLTSRPMPQLSLLANVKYERKEDKTPDALYNVEGGTNPAKVPTSINRYWVNYHVSTTKVTGKFEASYQLPDSYRATVGLDYNSLERPVPVDITEEEFAGLGALRAGLKETGYRLEIRRGMGDVFTGSLSYSKGKRTGSDWTSLGTSAVFVAAGLGYGQTGSANQFIAISPANAFPMSMVDLDRQKWKLATNWTLSENAELQFIAENSKDRSSMPFDPVALPKGWRGAGTTLYSLDYSLAISEKWKLNAYVSQGSQNLLLNHSTGYMADITARNNSLGFGITGKPSARMELGAKLAYMTDSTAYGLGASPTTTGTAPNLVQVAPSAANLAQVAIGIPNVEYKNANLSLYGKYALDTSSSVQVNLVHQRNTLNEWAWSYNGVPFTYSDNTTIQLKPNQTVTMLGVAYTYKFY